MTTQKQFYALLVKLETARRAYEDAFDFVDAHEIMQGDGRRSYAYGFALSSSIRLRQELDKYPDQLRDVFGPQKPQELVTAQQLFDDGAAHILRQDAICKNFGYCEYRNDAGQRCIIGGMLTTDELNEIYASGNSYMAITQLAPLVRADWVEHGTLLSDMQDAHDRTDNTQDSDWRTDFIERMRAVATKHKLNTTVLGTGKPKTSSTPS